MTNPKLRRPVAGIVLLLLGTLLLVDSFFGERGLSWTAVESALTANWRSSGDPLLWVYFSVHYSGAPFMATICWLLLFWRPKTVDWATVFLIGLGIWLCVQGLFPLFWIMFVAPHGFPVHALIISQQVGMLAICCFLALTPAGIFCVVAGNIIGKSRAHSATNCGTVKQKVN